MARLFVGNLPYTVTSDGLKELFETVGTVSSATVIVDRDSGRSRGFGFVEMEKDEDTQKAMSSMNGKDIEGRALAVSEAREQRDRDNNR